VAERAVALFERLKQLEGIAAASMKSDLQVARLMAVAGAQGAWQRRNQSGRLERRRYVSATRAKVATLRGKLVETPLPRAVDSSFLTGPERKEQDMNRIHTSVEWRRALCWPLELFSYPEQAQAQRLGNDTIALFPKNIGELPTQI